MIISFWAIWCKPCREEVPILNSLHAQSDELNVVILGSNVDLKQGEELLSDRERLGIQYPDLLQNPIDRWGQENPQFFPTTYIIDVNGRLTQVLLGEQSAETLYGAIGATPPT